MTLIKVNSEFDAGSIQIVDISNPHALQFKIRSDTNSHFAQWFYFQLINVKQQTLNINLIELDKTAYPDGWPDYNICASYDNKKWFRIASSFKNNQLTVGVTPKANSIYLAYFEPYLYDRHLRLMSFANKFATHTILGQTAQKRNIDLITVGSCEAHNKIWIIARQHPGETMAEWFMEGLIKRLSSKHDSVTINLLQNCVFYLVPNMNPDGSCNGNLRTNVTGTNLNREWLNPSIEGSPEVYYVRQKMLETGVDMFFDIHGDEAIPYVFTAGCEDNPSFSTKQKNLAELFQQYFTLINPDYQTQFGYKRGHFNLETPTVATNWVGNEFDCLAFTLEMPFKDNANLPNLKYGWNSKRSSLMGKSLLTVINILVMEHFCM